MTQWQNLTFACLYILYKDYGINFLISQIAHVHNHPSPNLATNKKKIVLIKAMPSVKVNL